MELSCPLGMRVMSRKEHLSCYGFLCRIINPLLTKLVRLKWLDIGLVLFLRVYGQFMDQFFVWFYSFVQLPTEAARVFFFLLSHSLKEKRLFLSSFVLVQYLDKTLYPIFTQSSKIF